MRKVGTPGEREENPGGGEGREWAGEKGRKKTGKKRTLLIGSDKNKLNWLTRIRGTSTHEMEKEKDVQASGEAGCMHLLISPLRVSSRHPRAGTTHPMGLSPTAQGPGRRETQHPYQPSQKTHWLSRVMCSPPDQSWVMEQWGTLIGQVGPTD